MALVTTPVFQGPDTFIGDCAWLDGDTTGNVTHNLGGVPQEVYYTYLASGVIAAVPMVGATVINSTIVTLAKVTIVAGSGAAAAGRIIIKRPHTTGR